MYLRVTLVVSCLLACGSDSGETIDSGPATDAAPSAADATPSPDGAGGADAAPPPGTYTPVGTPTTFAAGRGGRPIVAWPKPVNAHPDLPFEFTMVAHDEEHDRILFALSGAPEGMTIDVNGTIRWDPVVAGGPYSFTVEIDDGRDNPITVPVTLSVDAAPFIFVATDGDDDNDGTLGAPLADVDLAMRELTSRDSGTLYLRGGTYPIHWNWERDGVASPFRNADGSGVTLRRNIMTVAGDPGTAEGDPHFTWVWPWEDSPGAGILASYENCWWGTANTSGFRLGRDTTSFSGWQGWGLDSSSVFADPQFVADTYAPATGSACHAAAERVGAWE